MKKGVDEPNKSFSAMSRNIDSILILRIVDEGYTEAQRGIRQYRGEK
jgi:hypothetical protein